MFLNGGEFFSILAQVRTCWVAGDMGTGNTLFAVAVMDELLRRGAVQSVVSNVSTKLRGLDPKNVLVEDVGFIVDNLWLCEAGEGGREATSSLYCVHARQFNNYYVFPSIMEIDGRLSYFSVWRAMCLRGIAAFVISGLFGKGNWYREIWNYDYELKVGYEVKRGSLFLASPGQYFLKYDSLALPSDDNGIGRLLRARYKELGVCDVPSC